MTWWQQIEPAVIYYSFPITLTIIILVAAITAEIRHRRNHRKETDAK